MEYSKFKELATQYVEEHCGGLAVLSTYNKPVQDKVHVHMLNLMLKDCSQDFKEQQKIMKECKDYENRFYEERMK